MKTILYSIVFLFAVVGNSYAQDTPREIDELELIFEETNQSRSILEDGAIDNTGSSRIGIFPNYGKRLDQVEKDVSDLISIIKKLLEDRKRLNNLEIAFEQNNHIIGALDAKTVVLTNELEKIVDVTHELRELIQNQQIVINKQKEQILALQSTPTAKKAPFTFKYSHPSSINTCSGECTKEQADKFCNERGYNQADSYESQRWRHGTKGTNYYYAIHSLTCVD